VCRAATYSRIGPGFCRVARCMRVANEPPGRPSATHGPGLSVTRQLGSAAGSRVPLARHDRQQATPNRAEPGLRRRVGPPTGKASGGWRDRGCASCRVRLSAVQHPARRTHDPLTLPSAARTAASRNRSRSTPPTGVHKLVDQRPEPAFGRRRGRNPATRGPDVDHGRCPPCGRPVAHDYPVTHVDGERQVSLGADSHEGGNGQAHCPTEPFAPANQALTMTEEAWCDPKV
jgi:hypothetical protein